MAIGGFWCKCCQCDRDMWLPPALYEAAQAGKDKITFYCAYGHPQVFTKGESKLDEMRRARDRAVQENARLQDEINRQREQRRLAEAHLKATKGAMTRMKKRVGKGVCPCCNRTFSDLARHMSGKHPDYHAEAAE